MSRRALASVAAVASVLVLVGCGGEVSLPDTPDLPQIPTELPSEIPTALPGQEASTVTYEIGGDVGTATSVAYTTSPELEITREDLVSLPWTTEVQMPGALVVVLSLTAQSGGTRDQTITCRILRDGEVVSENSASGPFAVVNCTTA